MAISSVSQHRISPQSHTLEGDRPESSLDARDILTPAKHPQNRKKQAKKQELRNTPAYLKTTTHISSVSR